MSETRSPNESFPRHVRFHDFRLDLLTGDLERAGAPVRLQPQPASALVLLVSRAGQLVTRDELARHLWPDTLVEYALGLNNVVRLLRRILGDDPQRPRFIATVPRRGYRFVAPVEGDDLPTAGPPPGPEPRRGARRTLPSWVRRLGRRIAGGLPLALSAAALGISLASLWLAGPRTGSGAATLAVFPVGGTERDTEVLVLQIPVVRVADGEEGEEPHSVPPDGRVLRRAWLKPPPACTPPGGP